MKPKGLRWVSGTALWGEARGGTARRLASHYACQGSPWSPGCYPSSACTRSHNTLICVPLSPFVKKFALQRGTASASCTKLSDFGKYYNLPLFQRKEKSVVQRKGQQKGKEGGKKKTKRTKNHTFKMWSATYVQWQDLPWGSEGGPEALLFQETLSLCKACLQIRLFFIA